MGFCSLLCHWNGPKSATFDVDYFKIKKVTTYPIGFVGVAITTYIPEVIDALDLSSNL